MNDKPIGIFDSGLGGLTVFKELKKILPKEDIVYFGDTGRVPYGTRGHDTIIQYAKQDIELLRKKNVKFLIAACGTVSAVLPEQFSQSLNIPYLGVVLPAVKAACASTKTGNIAVLATTSAINSGVYQSYINNLLPDAKVMGIPCPLFVSLVENNYVERDNPVTHLVAQNYLKPVVGSDVDTVILGCTHFPIIKGIIGDVVGESVRLIDTGKEAARHAAVMMEQAGLLKADGIGKYSFYVSDSVDSFSENAELFLGEAVIGSVKQHIW